LGGAILGGNPINRFDSKPFRGAIFQAAGGEINLKKVLDTSALCTAGG
jgi:hypothetical protein